MRGRIYALSGGPSCGKSTLIDQFAKYGNVYGIITVPETARIVLDPEGKGATREMTPAVEAEIFAIQKNIEDLIIKVEPRSVILDRSVVDCLAYSKFMFGDIPEKAKGLRFSGVYDQVFILDRLPYKHDGTRIEKGEEQAEMIHQALRLEYWHHGYKPLIVPTFHWETVETSIQRRFQFIVDNLK